MKVLLHAWQKNHYLYEGLVNNLGVSKVISYLPSIFSTRYGDTGDFYDSTELLESIDEFDLIIFTPRSFYDRNFKLILNRYTSAIKVFMDLEDDFLLRNIIKHNEIRFYFKRELIENIRRTYWVHWYLRSFYASVLLPPVHRKIGFPVDKLNFLPYRTANNSISDKKLKGFPLSIGTSESENAINGGEKYHDLFYCMSLNGIKERKYYFEILKRDSSNLGTNTLVKPGGLSKEKYIHALKNSKASVSIRGMGFDTDRYWEIPAYGSMLISMRLPLNIRENFVDLESALFFQTYEELKVKFSKYVIHSNEWMEIMNRGHQKYLKFHTPTARVRDSLLSIIKS